MFHCRLTLNIMYEKVTHIPDSQRHRTAGAGGWWSGGGEEKCSQIYSTR